MKKLFWIRSIGVLLNCLSLTCICGKKMDMGLHHIGQVLILEGLHPDAIRPALFQALEQTPLSDFRITLLECLSSFPQCVLKSHQLLLVCGLRGKTPRSSLGYFVVVVVGFVFIMVYLNHLGLTALD